MKPAISIDSVSKKYRLGLHTGGFTTLRDRLASLLQRGPGGTPEDKEFWALRDVSCDVDPGEVLGLIGHNGAGKSTLLKILSRITEPTAGGIVLRGRVASLLEVGAGFHPELTGRENIFLNGVVLGMKRREVAQKMDEIVAFAGVDKFLDTPIKRYSSGMYVRLAFAVAAHLEPEILLVDEVLAVGDISFQDKCMGKIRELTSSGGRTVIFVSHNLGAISRICDSVAVMQSGRLVFRGRCEEAIARYAGSAPQSMPEFDDRLRRHSSERIRIVGGAVESGGKAAGILPPGGLPDISLDVQVGEATRFSVEILLRDTMGVPVAFRPSGLADDLHFEAGPGHYRVTCRMRDVSLAAGCYAVDLILADAGRGYFDYIESGLRFEVTAPATGRWDFTQRTGQGCFLLPMHFEMERRGPE